MRKAPTVILVILLLASLATVCWQASRIHHLTSENRELQQQTAERSRLRKENQPPREPDVDRAELKRLREAENQGKTELARVRGRLASALRDLSKADAERQAAQATSPLPTNQFSSGMMEMMRGVVTQQVEGRLTRMRTKVNLTPEQEKAISDILRRQAQQGVDAATKLFSGKLTPEETAKLKTPGGNPEEQIKALLSPEQQTAYQEFKHEENVSNARMAANAELMQLQTAVHLNTEQQDQAFAVLYDNTLNLMDGKTPENLPKDSDPAALLEWQSEQKIKAMEGVLTTEQIEQYRQFQQTQLKFIRSILPKRPENPAP